MGEAKLNRAGKRVVISQGRATRLFSYKKGNVELNFTLRTDIKTELKDCVEMLEVAIAEMRDEIKKK